LVRYSGIGLEVILDPNRTKEGANGKAVEAEDGFHEKSKDPCSALSRPN